MAWNFCREPGLGTPVVGLGSKHCCLAQTNSKSSEFRLKTSLPSILLLAWAQQQCFRPRQEFWAVASYSMVSAVLWQYENRKKHLVKTQLNKKIKIAPSNKKLTSLCWELRRACWRHLQGVQGQIFMFQLALRDRNMQGRFGLKIFWESWIVDTWHMILGFG